MLIAEIHTTFERFIGGGGLTVGGVFLYILWNAYKKWSEESDLRQKHLRKQISEYDQMPQHREKMREFWRATAGHQKAQESHLRAIRDDVREMRVRHQSGPHPTVRSDSRPIDIEG